MKPTYVGIVGHGSDKFTAKTEHAAKLLIHSILKSYKNPVLVSGHSPVKGIDTWSEEEFKKLYPKINPIIFAPKCNSCGRIEIEHRDTHLAQFSWDGTYGYKARNLDIAITSQNLHVILVDKLPPNYKGMRFEYCYHCKTSKHVKSGACWTKIQFERIHNQEGRVWVLNN